MIVYATLRNAQSPHLTYLFNIFTRELQEFRYISCIHVDIYILLK